MGRFVKASMNELWTGGRKIGLGFRQLVVLINLWIVGAKHWSIDGLVFGVKD